MLCKQNVELLIVALSLELLSDSNCMRMPYVEQALTPSISWGLLPLASFVVHVVARLLFSQGGHHCSKNCLSAVR